jgi:hypothetical protein
MRALLAPVAAAATFALSCTSAFSASVVSASVSFSNVVFRLVDLDPNDGITPWLNLNGFKINANASAYTQNNPDGQTSSESADFPFFGSLGGSVGSGDLNAQASVVRTGDVYDFSASGSAVRGSRFSVGISVGNLLQTVELSPKTFLEIIGDASAAVQMVPTQVPGCPSPDPACAHPDTGSARASLRLEVRDAHDAAVYNSINDLTLWVFHTDAVLHREESGRLGVSATNGGTQARQFEIDMSVSVYGGSYVWTPTTTTPPVPEPGPYALLVAGLGVLVLARRPGHAKKPG